MKKYQQADAENECDPQVGKCFGFYAGVGIDEVEEIGRREITDGCHHTDRKDKGHQKRLIDGSVNFGLITGTGIASYKDAHSGKEGGDKDDHDQKDLPANADRRVAAKADDVADNDMIHDALKPADHVGQHRGPCQFPNGAAQGALDDRTIVARALGLGRRFDGRRFLGHRTDLGFIYWPGVLQDSRLYRETRPMSQSKGRPGP
jgi:hypothetical protein